MIQPGNYVPLEKGMKLYYRDIGAGPESVVIPNARMLSEEYMIQIKKRRLIFYDQRGRGGSSAIVDKSLIWTDYEVDDIEALRKHLEIRSFATIGWSYMGAMVALYAQRFRRRVTRAILVCPVALRQPAPYDAEQERARELSESRIDGDELRKLEMMQQEGLQESDPIEFCRQHNRVYFPTRMVDAQAIERMVSDPCLYQNEWPQNVAGHWRRHFPAESLVRDWRDQLSDLDVPTLILHGSHDHIPLASSEEWAATVPDARLMVINDCGHFPHLEAPEIFFVAVNTFLQGTWPSGSVAV